MGGGGSKTRTVTRTVTVEKDTSKKCSKGHSYHKLNPSCPVCDIEQLCAERQREEALYTKCSRQHRHLKSNGCHICRAEADRKAHDQRAQKDREMFQQQIKEANDRAKLERAAAEQRHREAMSKLEEKDKELREKEEQKHAEEMRKQELAGLVMNYKGIKNEFDSFVKTCTPMHVPMQQALDKLREESKCHSTWAGVNVNDKSIIRLVLFSPTGHGKSTLANRILGDTSEDADGILPTSHLAVACTGSISHRVVTWQTESCEAQVCVIDTPGWDESPEADRKHANHLINYLRGAQFVHAICIVKNQSTRFQQSDCEMLEKLEAMVGEELWQHVMLVMTHVEGPRGRPAKLSRFNEWRDSLLQKLDRDYDLSDKLRRTAVAKAHGVTGGNRRSIKDIPVIGLSSFDDSGHDFDYRVAISKMIQESRRMGPWTFDSIVSPFDQLSEQFDKLCLELSEKEGKLKETIDKMKSLETEIRAHPESATACFQSFQSKYEFSAQRFVDIFARLKATKPPPAPEQKSPDHGEGATSGEHDDEKHDDGDSWSAM